MSDTADFAVQFHALVDDLSANGRHDTETMWLLGSLAARLVESAHADNWTDLKLRLDPNSMSGLVHTLSDQAAGFTADGKDKAAYVARLLGCSLVAGTLSDPLLRQRDQMLNTFVDTAATVFIENRDGPITLQ